LRSLTAVDRRESLLFLKDLIEDGKVTPAVTRTYPLNEAPQALSDADEGHRRGNWSSPSETGTRCTAPDSTPVDWGRRLPPDVP
jgi:hypothetical protein